MRCRIRVAHRYVGVVAAALLLSTVLSTRPAVAQTRTSPEATQHALDELANAIAQGKITRTPTQLATGTALPTATPEPTAMPAAATPGPTYAQATAPEAALPMPDIGQAISAYVLPSPRDPNGIWLELAMPLGRWAIRYDAPLCMPPAPWTNVWLTRDDQSNRPITVDRDDAAAMCTVAEWSWTSDRPCASDDQGTCAVELDSAYGDMIGVREPTTTDTPIPSPAPAPRSTLTPTAPVVPATPPDVVAPHGEVVVQTVVVVETAAPTSTRVATRTVPTSTPGPTRTATPTPTSSSTPTLEPKNTEIPLVVADVFATQVPPPVAQSEESAPALNSWNWTLTFVILAALLGIVAIWLFVARAGPLMW